MRKCGPPISNHQIQEEQEVILKPRWNRILWPLAELLRSCEGCKRRLLLHRNLHQEVKEGKRADQVEMRVADQHPEHLQLLLSQGEPLRLVLERLLVRRRNQRIPGIHPPLQIRQIGTLLHLSWG